MDEFKNNVDANKLGYLRKVFSCEECLERYAIGGPRNAYQSFTGPLGFDSSPSPQLIDLAFLGI